MLFVAGALAIGYAAAFNGIHNRLTPQKSPEQASFGSRGPFLGKLVGDCWVADEPRSHFTNGETVVWQMHPDIRPGTTMMVETELWCQDREVQFEDAQLTSDKLKAGWASLAVHIPSDVTGQCHLERHVQVQDAEGATIHDYDLRRPVSLVVDP